MICLFANNYFYLRGGSERVFFDEIEILRDHGHEVVPFSRQDDKNDATQYAHYFAPPLAYENVSMVNKITTSFKLIYSRECGRKFSDAIRQVKPDVIHSHNIYGRLTTAVLDSAGGMNIPVVMTLHDMKLICPTYLMLSHSEICERCKGGHFYHCTFRRCHRGGTIPSLIYTVEAYFNELLRKYERVRRFICPSLFLLRKHRDVGIPEEKLVHIPNFIDSSRIEPVFRKGTYVLYVGRLSKEKGVLTLLRALSGLKVNLRVAGEGPMRDEFETFVTETGLRNVSFEGYRAGEALTDLYRNAAILVFPSQCYENAPMTILEAFAHGKPVIGSSIGGIPEMVIDGVTGLLFKPGDYRDLREKIQYLLKNHSLIETMGKNARKKVEDEHNTELHYQKLIEVYNRALS
jgi:glycosyltransferase involved in cell wall biosynthesis